MALYANTSKFFAINGLGIAPRSRDFSAIFGGAPANPKLALLCCERVVFIALRHETVDQSFQPVVDNCLGATFYAVDFVFWRR